ncbi:hypothetical protein B0I37DRAFT_401645 [Chaetomium sp. MPI-CAGE-AT-0009]|nr:hypothetical protein B0I37DRAFT_401645 [Chaetomium sp. MPI-CAGE-AT-0009]
MVSQYTARAVCPIATALKVRMVRTWPIEIHRDNDLKVHEGSFGFTNIAGGSSCRTCTDGTDVEWLSGKEKPRPGLMKVVNPDGSVHWVKAKMLHTIYKRAVQENRVMWLREAPMGDEVVEGPAA